MPTVEVVPSLPSQSQNMRSLKKGATFHSSLSPREVQDPTLNVPLLPQRCPTDAKSLEAIASTDTKSLEAIAAMDTELSQIGRAHV